MNLLGSVGSLIALGCIGFSLSDEQLNSVGDATEAPESSSHHHPILGNTLPNAPSTSDGPLPCVCGVFLSGQFEKGRHEPPKGYAALMHEHPDPFPCTPVGNKQCTNKCLDIIVRHLPNSPSILCGSIDRDCHKERAHLFIKNCNDTWINTNLSAGREYCCKDGLPYKCPILS